ncbi:MAG: cation:proton antiporter [Myxococcales bacterium]|nr:cation:proton antiporter [Myxococcales bacterium]
MDSTTFMWIALFVLGYGLVSKRLERTIVTPPMVFVTLGLVFGSGSLAALSMHIDQGVIHVLAELTLVLVLFGDAARIDLRVLRNELGLPARLLGIGMPLTIILGALVAMVVFPQVTWLEAATLGAILAPTDAALGQAVVSTPSVPLRIRQALNVESGLNDGIAVPVVLIFAALASMGGGDARTASEWVWFAALQVTLGPLAGVLVAWVGGRLINWSEDRGWMNSSFARLAGIALALLAFASAEHIGGNGFIAAFVAGMTLGNSQRGQCEYLYEFLEAEGQLLVLLVFLLLGVSLAWPALAQGDGRMWLYAVLSLTVIRMVPVAISMVGSGLRAPSVVFLGWFGPRGLASLLFAILILEEAALPHGDLVFDVVILTVLASVFAHGMSAAPAAEWYGRMAGDATHCPEEHKAVVDQPLRI